MRKLHQAILVLTLFAGTALAQSSGVSVLIYSYGKVGTEAHGVATYLANQIGKGMLSQHPCVDQYDYDSILGQLDLERRRQLLGAESNDETLKNIAGAFNATYIIVARSTTMPNGQTYTSAKVINTRTGQTVASRDGPPASGDAAAGSAEAIAGQLLRDVSGLFKAQCEARWIGTITITLRQQGSQKQTGHSPVGAGLIETTENTGSWQTESAIEVLLQPLTLGAADTNHPMARVVHRYYHHDDHFTSLTTSLRCGPKRTWTGASRKTADIAEESGQKTAELPVDIFVDGSTGRYEISVSYPAFTTKRHEERSDTNPGVQCEPKPTSSASDSEGSPESGAYTEAGSSKISGQIDLKNPDTLAGTEVRGDLENLQTTTTWSLHLVKPKPKK